MHILYCEKWWLSEKKPIKPLDDKAACLRHNKREPYTAIISENENPEFIVNCTGKWVSVYFLDEFFRKYLQYDFKEVKENKLFLNTAMYWEYEGNTDIEVSNMIFRFQEDGHTLMEKRNLKTNEVEERQVLDSVDNNWEDYPQFGQYGHLCKEQR